MHNETQNTGRDSTLGPTDRCLKDWVHHNQRVGVTFGVGYQVAVTQEPAYNHNIILSGRIPF